MKWNVMQFSFRFGCHHGEWKNLSLKFSFPAVGYRKFCQAFPKAEKKSDAFEFLVNFGKKNN